VLCLALLMLCRRRIGGIVSLLWTRKASCRWRCLAGWVLGAGSSRASAGVRTGVCEAVIGAAEGPPGEAVGGATAGGPCTTLLLAASPDKLLKSACGGRKGGWAHDTGGLVGAMHMSVTHYMAMQAALQGAGWHRHTAHGCPAGQCGVG
jgi:hypothetical protein